MTVRQAIQELSRLLERYRDPAYDRAQLYFDCPHCRKSFTPDFVAVQAEQRIIVPSEKRTDE